MLSEKHRILMVNDHIHFGGGGDAVFRLELNAYEEAGYEVFTFSQAVERSKYASDRDFVATEHKSRIVRKAGKFLAAPSVSRLFRETLRSVRPHFISVHLVSKYPLSIYPQLSAYPVVQTLHGSNLFCATSWGCLKNGTLCEMGIGAKCFTRGCKSLSGSFLYKSLDMRLSVWVKRNVDLFVCPSKHIFDSAESLGFTPVEFAPLGIDDQFKAAPSLVHEGPPKVLYVGSLVEQKGVHFLLEAFRSVLARVPDAHLVIAGQGVMSEALHKQAEDNGFGSRVKFMGFVEHSEIVELYRRATVLAVPSIWKEQFGLVGPEALASGTPCVGSDIGGIPEWLHDGEWGFIVPPRDPLALADRIVILLENRNLCQEFGARGRAWALEKYSPDKYREYRLSLVHDLATSTI